MKQDLRSGLSVLALATALSAVSSVAVQAEEAEAAAVNDLEEIVVTAVPGSASRLQTAVSTSVLRIDKVENFAPRSTAEIFRNIPGIRSESSGGGGNANIAVRGLPISTGGAKFLSLQEDGLPVLQFGDIAFGNADNFLRADNSISKIEAIRGGSASTLAQNSPGGVINFISKTGANEGGSLGVTRGIDFDQTRIDAEYGGRISDTMLFHVGGFYRVGEGPRDAGFNGDNGGQIKANITKEFENGYVRLYLKHLNDRAITYLPMPLLATGTNDSPDFQSVPGFDAKSDTPHTPFLLSNYGLDGDNNFRTGDVRDGIRALTTSVGLEFSFELANDWVITNRGRYADNSGGFISPFPAQIAAASDIAESIGGAGATLAYASGPNAGDAITDPSSLNGNGLAMQIALFDTKVNDFNNFANDLKLTKSIAVENGDLDVTFGYYKSSQNIDMDWIWNSYVFDVDGSNGALLDVIAEDGTAQTVNGLFQYGDPFGGCCTRAYDARYNTDAPYVSLYWATDKLTLDGSLRYTYGDVSGFYAGTQRSQFDVNGDGSISVPEQNVSFVDLANPSPVDYSYDYFTYSFGANYLLTDDAAVFARYSKGASANADRLLFDGNRVLADGSLADESTAVDFVSQVEAGVKYRSADGLTLFVTGFYATTEETNFNLTDQTFTDREYRAFGLELEGAYSLGPVDMTLGATWTDAEITKDNINPELEGNKPRRQADLIYQATVAYNGDNGFMGGTNIVGTTKSYSQFNNDLVMPGFAQVNLFAQYEFTEGLVLSLNVNNLFDTLGVTEIEEGSIAPNSDNYLRARAINGRTTSVSLKYSF